MSDSVKVEIQDNSLTITFGAWVELVTGTNTVAQKRVIRAAENFIKTDGSFIVYRENHEIQAKCDRLDELKRLVDTANKLRSTQGDGPLEV